LATLLVICSSLVTIVSATVKVNSSKVSVVEELRLSHFSVKEYLVSDRIQKGPACWFSITESGANDSMTNMSLAYLLQFDQPNCLDHETETEYPLIKYAAKYWTQHAKVAEKAERDSKLPPMPSLSMELLVAEKEVYINCVRMFDPDRDWEYPNVKRKLIAVPHPLYYASHTGLIQSVELLVENGADVNVQGGYYGNALQAASFKGHEAVAKLLIENGAKVNAQGGRGNPNALGGYNGNVLQAANLGAMWG
jgi:hypothetical protein